MLKKRKAKKALQTDSAIQEMERMANDNRLHDREREITKELYKTISMVENRPNPLDDEVLNAVSRIKKLRRDRDAIWTLSKAARAVANNKGKK